MCQTPQSEGGSRPVLGEAAREALRRLAASRAIGDRRECLRRLWWAASPGNADIVFELLELLARDARQEIRWGAVDGLSDLVRRDHEGCWSVIQRLGSSRSADVRAAVAVKLLRQLPDSYFPLIRERILAGDWQMREMLGLREWNWGPARDAPERAEWTARNLEMDVLAPPYWLLEIPLPPDLAAKRARNRIGRMHPYECWHPRPRFNAAEREALRYLAASRRFARRYLCLEWLREGQYLAQNARFVLDLTEELATDPRDDIYALALYILECAIEPYPERVWGAFERLSTSSRPAFLGCLAAFLLEHLLGFDCEKYLPRVRAQIEAGSWRMASMLASSWILDTAKEHADEIMALLLGHRALLRPL